MSDKFTIDLHTQAFTIKVVENGDHRIPTYFKPGIPFEIWVQVVHYDGSPVLCTDKDELQISHEKTGYAYSRFNETQAYKLDANGMAAIKMIYPEPLNDDGYSFDTVTIYVSERV